MFTLIVIEQRQIDTFNVFQNLWARKLHGSICICIINFFFSLVLLWFFDLPLLAVTCCCILLWYLSPLFSHFFSCYCRTDHHRCPTTGMLTCSPDWKSPVYCKINRITYGWLLRTQWTQCSKSGYFTDSLYNKYFFSLSITLMHLLWGKINK